MKKFILSLIAVATMSFAASAANYSLNEDAVDAMIESCAEISPLTMTAEFPAASAVPSNGVLSTSHNNPVGAFLLCTFLGGFGIHRHYLGTSKGMWAVYTFTFGGIFGVVPLIDWVMLIVGLVDDDVTPYLNNSKFFMWA